MNIGLNAIGMKALKEISIMPDDLRGKTATSVFRFYDTAGQLLLNLKPRGSDSMSQLTPQSDQVYMPFLCAKRNMWRFVLSNADK